MAEVSLVSNFVFDKYKQFDATQHFMGKYILNYKLDDYKTKAVAGKRETA